MKGVILDFQSSQTYINLQNALKNEFETSTKYDMFGVQARDESLIEVSNIFNNISENQILIAQRLWGLINDGDTTTLENLRDAASDEEYAERELYREYSRVALEEGYDDLAQLFNGIANIKLNHTVVFQTTATELEDGSMFCKEEEGLWLCLGCGNILIGLCAPEICPICLKPQSYYQFLRYY